MTKTMLGRLVGVVGVFAITATSPMAQERRAEPATLNDVLRELQSIRAELQSMSRASLQVQALVARVSLQEQRLKALSEQLTEANVQLTAMVEAREEKERRLQQLEGILTTTATGAPPREEIEQVLAVERPALASMRSRENELRGRVSELADLVSIEQARWTDFNSRLDAFEQSLQRP